MFAPSPSAIHSDASATATSGTWSDPRAYDAQARRLAEMFAKNFEPFVVEVPPAVATAGPRRK